MNYPFLYQIIGSVDLQILSQSILRTNKIFKVWEDWNLEVIESDYLTKFVSQQFGHLKILHDKFFISSGNESNVHIDRYNYFRLTHRVLIPLSDNFFYQWYINETEHRFKPVPGQVILFNNMIPHNFVKKNSDSDKREVIYFDLYDEKLEPVINSITTNNSANNADLAEKFQKND